MSVTASACKETAAVVAAERGRDGELESLRCECIQGYILNIDRGHVLM